MINQGKKAELSQENHDNYKDDKLDTLDKVELSELLAEIDSIKTELAQLKAVIPTETAEEEEIIKNPNKDSKRDRYWQRRRREKKRSKFQQPPELYYA